MCLFYEKRLGGKSGTKCSSLRSNVTYQISLDTYGFCLKVIKNDVQHLRKKMEREIDEGECQDQSPLVSGSKMEWTLKWSMRTNKRNRLAERRMNLQQFLRHRLQSAMRTVVKRLFRQFYEKPS